MGRCGRRSASESGPLRACRTVRALDRRGCPLGGSPGGADTWYFPGTGDIFPGTLIERNDGVLDQVALRRQRRSEPAHRAPRRSQEDIRAGQARPESAQGPAQAVREGAGGPAGRVRTVGDSAGQRRVYDAADEGAPSPGRCLYGRLREGGFGRASGQGTHGVTEQGHHHARRRGEEGERPEDAGARHPLDGGRDRYGARRPDGDGGTLRDRRHPAQEGQRAPRRTAADAGSGIRAEGDVRSTRRGRRADRGDRRIAEGAHRHSIERHEFGQPARGSGHGATGSGREGLRRQSGHGGVAWAQWRPLRGAEGVREAEGGARPHRGPDGRSRPTRSACGRDRPQGGLRGRQSADGVERRAVDVRGYQGAGLEGRRHSQGRRIGLGGEARDRRPVRSVGGPLQASHSAGGGEGEVPGLLRGCGSHQGGPVGRPEHAGGTPRTVRGTPVQDGRSGTKAWSKPAIAWRASRTPCGISPRQRSWRAGPSAS